MGNKHLIVVDVDGSIGKKYHPDIFVKKVLEMDPEEFWDIVVKTEQQFPQSSDVYVTFPGMLLHLYQKKFGQNPRRGLFLEVGQELNQDYFYPGAETFFPELKADHPERDFYCGPVTQGIVPMIEGSRFGKTIDFIRGYDFVTEDGSRDGLITMVGQNCSNVNKGALIHTLSQGDGVSNKSHQWPFEDAFYVIDGDTDKSIAHVAKDSCGIIIVEHTTDQEALTERVRYAEGLRDKGYGTVISLNDFRRGGPVRDIIDKRIRTL